MAAPPGGGDPLVHARVIIRTDGDPGDAITDPGGGDGITWTIHDALGFPIASGGPYPGQNGELIEVPVDLSTMYGSCFSLYIHDDEGDGLCCANGNGYWELRTTDGGLLLRDRFTAAPDGSDSPSTTPVNPWYTVGHEFCLPSGTTAILANECDVFTNDLLNKIRTSTVPGALNYQFELSDPDAGARRRITTPRPWFRMVELGDHETLVPGDIYFCRARADQGAAGFGDDHFGTGCELGLDASLLVQCSQLIDRPGYRNHSCGASKHFGGSDKVWAVPVLYADEYRFHFHRTDGTLDRSITLDHYVCVLDWDTQPLSPGDYTVTVEVSVAGQWSGLCGAACALTILEGTHSPEQREDLFAGMPVLDLYPNPVQDHVVILRMDQPGRPSGSASVTIHDGAGRRVMATTLPFQNGLLQTALELPPEMTSGVYFVTVQAGEGRRMGRLVIGR